MGRRKEFESAAPESAVAEPAPVEAAETPKLMEGAKFAGGELIKPEDRVDPRTLPSWKYDLANPNRERSPEEIADSDERRINLHEYITDKAEQGLKESAEKAKADEAARKANEAARLAGSTTEAAETPEQREAKRMEYVRGGRRLNATTEPEDESDEYDNYLEPKDIDRQVREGAFLREANKKESLTKKVLPRRIGKDVDITDPTTYKTEQFLTKNNKAEPAWKQAGFSSAEEHATELAELYKKEYPSRNLGKRDRLLDIGNQERRWPIQLDPTSIDVPTPTASQETVDLYKETGGSEKAAKPATSSPEEALSIARRQGGTGSAAQRAVSVDKEAVKAEKSAYEAERAKDFEKFYKEGGGFVEGSEEERKAHDKETADKLTEYDRKIGAKRTQKSRSVDKAVTEEQQERTTTGNTEAALRGLADDFKIAHESGDVIGRERARTAYHNVAELEGYVADIDTPCTTANCGNIIKGESQIPQAVFKPIPGRTLGVSKSETEFRQTGVAGGDEEGTVCKDCAAKGL